MSTNAFKGPLQAIVGASFRYFEGQGGLPMVAKYPVFRGLKRLLNAFFEMAWVLVLAMVQLAAWWVVQLTRLMVQVCQIRNITISVFHVS